MTTAPASDPLGIRERSLSDLSGRFNARWAPDEATGCWLWTGWISESGYGQMFVGRRGVGRSSANFRAMAAHKVSWRLHRGEIPAGLSVLHRCDVRACVNYEHLFLGTHKDNMADMRSRQRQARGSANGASSLSEDEVKAIDAALRSGLSQTEIAKRFGVNRGTVTFIAGGQTWGWITGREPTSPGLPRGDRHRMAKLSESQVREIVRLLDRGDAHTAVAELYGVSSHAIDKIACGRTWSWLTGRGTK